MRIKVLANLLWIALIELFFGLAGLILLLISVPLMLFFFSIDQFKELSVKVLTYYRIK